MEKILHMALIKICQNFFLLFPMDNADTIPGVWKGGMDLACDCFRNKTNVDLTHTLLRKILLFSCCTEKI